MSVRVFQSRGCLLAELLRTKGRISKGLHVVTETVSSVLGKEHWESFYGTKIRQHQFLLDNEITPLNHNGNVPRSVLAIQRKFQDETEKCPNMWFKSKLRPLWNQSLHTVADFVGGNMENMVFVQNASTGIMAVLRSLDFNEDDTILVTSETYTTVRLAVDDVCKTAGSKLQVLSLRYRTADCHAEKGCFIEDIVCQFKEYLSNNVGVKLAVIDYIGSSNAVLYPVKELVDLCHQHNVAVLIDGAHAPGQVPLNLEELGADFFVGNIHKWMFAPRGCAFLWVLPRHHDVVKPLVVSWLHDGSFQDKFFMQATLDYTPYVTAETAIKFYNDIGGLEALTEYNQGLVSWASSMLANGWCTEILPVPLSMRAPFLGVVRLPDPITAHYGASRSGCNEVTYILYNKFKVLVYVVCIQGSLWCRIVAHVYNSKKDYFRLLEAVQEMTSEVVTMFESKE